MDEERIYALMSDALDDLLDEAESAELQARLNENAALLAEWEALQAVDQLFRATPMMAPPPTLVSATLARLPDTRVRLWWSGVVFMGLFVVGLLPILLLTWAVAQSGFLAQPDALAAVGETLGTAAQFLQVMARSLATSMRNVVFGQPLVLGWLTLLLGILFTWRTVYAQFMQPVLVPVPVQDESVA